MRDTRDMQPALHQEARSGVSIILLAFNKARYTRLCLQSLLQSSYRPLQVLAVNNGSTDDTAALLEAFGVAAEAVGIETTVLSFAQNVGAVAARNHALEQVHGEWILFLDNDVMLRSLDLCEHLVAFLTANPGVGAVSPKLVYPRFPYLVQCAGGTTTREGLSYLVGRGEERTHIEHNRILRRDWLITACMMVPWHVVQEVGKLDMVFHPLYFEDVDYCCRIRVRGYDVCYYPKAEIYHFENVSSLPEGQSGTNRSIRSSTPALVQRNHRIFWRKWRHLFAKNPSRDNLPWVWSRVHRVPIEEVSLIPTVCGDCTLLI